MRLIDLAERGNACSVKDSGEDDVCLVTNLPRHRCDHCIGTDAFARAQVAGRTRTITARRKSVCNYCHDPIEIGDQIRHDLGGVKWVHADHDLHA